MHPKGQPSTDQSRYKVGADHPCYRDEVAQQLFKIEISIRPGWAEGSQAREAVHKSSRSYDLSVIQISDLENGSSNRNLTQDPMLTITPVA